ncbi:MAG: SinI family restriction endonuclease [Solirubrobacterales bacterium]
MPDFISNASDVARNAIRDLDPSLEESFVSLIDCMVANPEFAGRLRGADRDAHFGDEHYIRRQAQSFVNGRKPGRPTRPSTFPDEVVSLILAQYFDVAESDLSLAAVTHQWSMAAENFVGELLERYLASNGEPIGWVWCAGSLMRSIDFVCPPATPGDDWVLLQVKNRDNSENSSSSAVRDGTTIIKWFRSYSRREGETNWENCPIDCELSEAGFRAFVVEYFDHIDNEQFRAR